jgi:hypothetical protein
VFSLFFDRVKPSCLLEGKSLTFLGTWTTDGPRHPLSESRSPPGWRSAPTLNPKMRRGLGVLLDRWNEQGELKNTQGFRVVRAAGA